MQIVFRHCWVALELSVGWQGLGNQSWQFVPGSEVGTAPGPGPLFAQDCAQVGFGYLQGWKAPNSSSGQPGLSITGIKAFPDVPGRLLCSPLCPSSGTGHTGHTGHSLVLPLSFFSHSFIREVFHPMPGLLVPSLKGVSDPGFHVEANTIPWEFQGSFCPFAPPCSVHGHG